QIRSEEAVGLRGGRPVGEGADRTHGEAARAPHRQTGQRPGAEHEPIVRMVPRDVALASARLAIEDPRAEPGAADELTHLVRRPRLGPRFPLREIDTQKLAGIAAGHRGLRFTDLSRSAQRYRAHTATGVSPGAFEGRPST